MTTGRGKGKITPAQLAEEFWAGFKRDRFEMLIGKTNLLALVYRIAPSVAEKIILETAVERRVGCDPLGGRSRASMRTTGRAPHVVAGLTLWVTPSRAVNLNCSIRLLLPWSGQLPFLGS